MSAVGPWQEDLVADAVRQYAHRGATGIRQASSALIYDGAGWDKVPEAGQPIVGPSLKEGNTDVTDCI